ncbi:hypothetical protein CEXT_459481 [Caerostris extrusa]|uniref:Uncharacterized protein n=1 Tax=Caerostris extrusa TaxID=172846 RepID=A0AAV4YCC2_CAEEX|nr:hypothetical protein CEXT_459481 [Caerostris extrusa]
MDYNRPFPVSDVYGEFACHLNGSQSPPDFGLLRWQTAKVMVSGDCNPQCRLRLAGSVSHSSERGHCVREIFGVLMGARE